MTTTRSISFVLAAGALLPGCVNEPSGIETGRPPEFLQTAVEPSPHNVLSLIVTAHVQLADSVAVRFRAADANADEEGVTPAVSVRGDFVLVPVFGLQPERTYLLDVVAWGRGGTSYGTQMHAITGALPADLPTYSAGGLDPSPGLVVFAAGSYGLVIDNTGRVVWYRRFPNGPGLNFMAQPTGHYVVRPPTSEPGDIEPWLELDALGNVTRKFGCERGLPSRFHDLISEPGGNYWILCDEYRTMDLSAAGGHSAARVTGTVVQHVAADGALLFEWSPFDHFAITDLDPAERTGVNVNWTHGNSLDFADDGNLLLSFRSLGEITKIDVRSGDVIWRMGGLANQFTFLDAQVPPFSRQHSVRATGNGQLLLLDNLGDPQQSRAERYLIDEDAMTTRLVQSAGAGHGYVTSIGGSVQDLPDGRTLAAYGTAGRVEEYDATGRVVWSITGNAGYVFRAQRIASLYAPGVGTAR
ncbi:MAG: aryl-sulfate sulfotransferase [Gemmatimonadetes bacterium]|nr:aryl-sulfate sulfotransferase [Gemmatimonadota bacterium]